ncbi:MAG: TonB-dependent receptor plug domain-containing protein [Cytophagales bacterium]|nr:TonB-dependent receptor plug domain-containing protein [Cytophagales bacterium]
MKLLFIFLVILFFLPCFAYAQKPPSSKASGGRYTISGYVEDAGSGEKLIGAHVYETGSLKGTTTNIYGFYSLTLPSSDSVEIAYSYIGYQIIKRSIRLQSNQHINISLNSAIVLEEVEITGTRIEDQTQMSVIEVPISQIKTMPAFLGEVDVLKSLQMLPGVQSGGEGTSGLYVRGGGPDQNLILLDGAPVYNASHLFGFFSVFNADAIKNIQFTKGGFPARYGGRLSSVIEINVKEGNMKKFTGEGSVGIIAARLTVEGPIKKEKTSFIISGRRTYIDILARPFILAASEGEASGGYYFYDLNAKVNHKFSDRDRLYLSFYTGDDRFYLRASDKYTTGDGTKYEYNNIFRLGWGNITSSLRWNHILNKKLFSNAALTYSRFKFYTTIKIEDIEEPSSGEKIEESFNLKYFSGIRDWTAKVDFDYFPNPDHYIKFGMNNILHRFNTGAVQFQFNLSDGTDLDTTFGSQGVDAYELALYFEDDIRFSRRLKANLGLHTSGFLVNDEFYYSIQPRISSRYYLTDNWALKSSFATMTQYIHLLTNSNISLPTDLWVPATDIVKPQHSQQVALGIARTIMLHEKKYELSVEGYYKWMQNIIEYIAGANFLDLNADWQTKVEAGKGWSYGAELFLQKKTGKTTGWLGYTLSWTNRQFETINLGKKYPYKYDRRHDVAIVITYKVDKNIDFSANWIYGTGNAITLPIARYKSINDFANYWPGYEIEYYGDKNSFRMRAYHRFDIGINFHKKKKWGERTWTIGVYNVYNRKNPYFLYFGVDNRGDPALKQVSLFPILPSFSYSFKF